MSRSTGVAGTAVAVTRRRPRVTAVVLVLGAVMSMTVTAFAVLHDSSTAAIRQSVQADFGQRQYVIQSADPTVSAKFADRTDVVPVVDDDGTLTADGLTADVLLRSTTDPALELGVLTSGRRPSKPGEALISEVLANSLGVRVGDRVEVTGNGGHARVVVSGLLVDPSDSSARIVVQLVAASAAFTPTRWLADFDPVDDPSLGRYLSPPATVVGSVKRAVSSALETQPRVVSTLRFLPAGAAAILGLLLLGILAGLAERWRPTATTLQAAGMTARSSWLVFTEWVTAAVLLGQVLGIALVLVLLTAFKRPVSGWFGQSWASVAIPTWTIVLMLACTAALAMAAMPCLQRMMTTTRQSLASTRVRRPTRMWLLAPWSAAGVYWAYLAFVDDSGADESMVTATLFGALTLALTPYALEPLLTLGLTPSVRSMCHALVGQMRLVAALAACVVFCTGVWSAQTFYAAGQEQVSDSPLQPPRSLLVHQVPDDSVAMIRNMYRTYGGQQVRSLRVPAEVDRVIRVTSPRLVGCVTKRHAKNPEDVPSRCWPDSKATGSPINQIALGSGNLVLADGGLIQDGMVGLLDFDITVPDGPIADAISVRASADPDLGGSVVGLVLPTTGALARRYGLTPSGVSQMLLLDYGTLAPAKRLRVRSEIARLAPTTLFEDSSGPSSYDRMRSAAAVGGLFGAASVALLLLLGGYASVQTAGAARRAIQDLGAVPHVRWSLVARWLAVPALSGLFGGGVAYATVSLGGRVADFSYGPLWAAPVAATLLVAVVLGTWFARPASDEWDVPEA